MIFMMCDITILAVFPRHDDKYVWQMQRASCNFVERYLSWLFCTIV